jgi:hypothetical protein
MRTTHLILSGALHDIAVAIVLRFRSGGSCEGHQDFVLGHQAHNLFNATESHDALRPKRIDFQVILNNWSWTLG